MAGEDEWDHVGTPITAPAVEAFEITPDDAQDLAKLPRAVYVGGAGDVRCALAYGPAVTIRGLAAGTILPFRVRRLHATGTTATGLVAVL